MKLCFQLQIKINIRKVIEPWFINVKGVVVEFHEANQSLALKGDFDWTHANYFKFIDTKRRIVEKAMRWTINDHISKSDKECYDDKNHNPDYEMMKMIFNRVGCNLPWSKLQLPGLKACSEKKDFQNYLKHLEDLKNEIKSMPKKCKFNSWTTVPFEESGTKDDNGSTSLEISFYVDEKKVK